MLTHALVISSLEDCNTFFCGIALEDHSQITPSPECSDTCSYGYTSVHPCNTITL